jgi:hypothetical protein
MKYPIVTFRTPTRTILSWVSGLAIATIVGGTAHAALSSDAGSIARTSVGIEIPAGWNLGSTPVLGTVTYSAKATTDATSVGTAKRLEGSVHLADYVIKESTAMATELTINFVRDGAVYGQCTFDNATSLGAPTANLADYQLIVIERADGNIQSQVGVCKVTSNGTDFVPGIPDVRDTDTLQLVANNLTLQSTLP